MAVEWTAELIEQLRFYWEHHFRPRLGGLTDDEYFWEPVPDCWSIRPLADGSTGTVRFMVDWAWPAPTPAPFTTIAWRLGHIGSAVLALRANAHFGDGALTIDQIEWPGTADDAIRFVEAGYTAWMQGLATLSEADLAREVGPAEGPYSKAPFATLILHINREIMHHGAEVALLRDLYRASGAGGPAPSDLAP